VSVITGIAPSELLADPVMFLTILDVLKEQNKK
jgi:hypothetical protein